MRTWNDVQLRVAVAESRNVSQVLRALGLRPFGGNYETVRRRVRELALDTSHWKRWRLWDPTAEEFFAAVKAADSITSALRTLGWPYNGTTYMRFHELVAKHGVDLSHFGPKGSLRGRRLPERVVPIERYLTRAGPRIKSSKLRLRLISEALLPDCCYGCERTSWCGVAIPLELDHINGDRDDNRLENLRLLCPNCHALTPTYRGRNIGKRRTISA